jgi:hypothetical protein
MLSDDEIRRRIAKVYGPRLTSCDQLLTHAQSEMAHWSGRAVKRGADRISLAEIARATKTFDGAIRLCRDGFGEQAAMLNRSLFEAMVITHWTSIHRREAVGLFTRHAQFTSALWFETLDALGWLDDGDRAKQPKLGPKRAEFVKLFGPYGTRPWVRRNVPTLVDEIEHLWDDAGRAQLRATHAVPHTHNNQMLHSTATAVSAAHLGATTTELRLTIGPSNLLVEQALLAGYWTYGQVLSLLIDVFRLKDRAAFEELFDDGMRAFDAPPEET